MTNSEYIRKNINDNDLAEILTSLSFGVFQSEFIRRVHCVFEYWASKEYTIPGRNFYETRNEMIESASTLGYIETLYLHDEDKWIRYGRTSKQGMNLFLSLQYDKEYWNKAIAEHDKKWSD